MGRTVVLFSFLLSLNVFASAQIKGETRQVNVPMRSESWWATASASNASATSRAARSHESALDQSASSSPSILGKVFTDPRGNQPSDAMIAAGPNHLMLTMSLFLSSIMVIYDKNGNFISFNDFASFFRDDHCCFDPRILFDQAHQVFVVVGSDDGPDRIYLAVSQTSDPTGNWNKYTVDFGTNQFFADFPGLGISSSAIYIATDQAPFNNGGPSSGSSIQSWITVIQLADALAGNSNLNITQFKNVKDAEGRVVAAIEPAITYGDSPQEFLISDPPPTGAGSTIPLFSINTSGTPTLNVRNLTILPFRQPPNAPQPGTANRITTQGNILSPVWRNGSLWFTQGASDATGQHSVVRWYQVDTNAAKMLQSGSVAGLGDAYYGAITVLPDGEADMVYTTSSASQFASAGYAHRSPSDPPNTMPLTGVYQAGGSVVDGTHWGDLFAVSPDPDGNSAWGVAGIAPPPHGTVNAQAVGQLLAIASSSTADFTLAANPTSLTVQDGASATSQITISGTNGFNGAVALSVTGLPAGATATFNPASITGSGTTTLTITAGASTPAGNSSLTVTATSGAITHTVAVPLTVNAATPGSDFTISASPASATVSPGQSTSYSVMTAAQNGFNGNVALSVTGLPANASASFAAPQLPASGSTMLTITAGANTPAGDYPLTITGTSGSLVHSTMVTFTVSAAAPGAGDFSIALSPPSATVTAGATASYTITISPQNGFNSPVSFACTGLPAKSACAFSPAQAASGNIAMQITTAGPTAALFPRSTDRLVFAIWTGLAGFGALGLLFLGDSKKHRSKIVLCCVFFFGLSALACGGSSGKLSGPPQPTPGTPAGTYTVTVTGTSGSLQHSGTVNLVVQ